MAKWTFEPVAAEKWAAEADSVFWKRFKRQHPSRQATMLERQLPVLEETAATVLAETFALDDEVEARTRDTAFAFLVERALEQDQPLTAAELSTANCAATGGNRRLVTRTLLEHGSEAQAGEAASAMQRPLDRQSYPGDLPLVGLLMNKAGDAAARSNGTCRSLGSSISIRPSICGAPVLS